MKKYNMKKYNVAVVGATGAVGQALLTVLTERNFPINNLYALASTRSVGQQVSCQGRHYTVTDLAEFDFSKADIGLFSPGASVSAIYAPIAAKKNCVVIDNTSQFRYDDDIPLVIPEVNPQAIAQYSARNIIANPNCSTIQMLVALKPIYDAVGIKRINVVTFQSVSGTGIEAINELQEQTKILSEDATIKIIPKVYNRQIAFNVVPEIDVFQDNNYTKEEMKMVWETRKILNDDTIQANPTCVRVPVFIGHSEAVHIETKKKITRQQALDLLATVPIIKLYADNAVYPTALDAAGNNLVHVGRVREDISQPHGLNLWIVSDNIRKGAAYNAVQIAEELISKYL